MYYVVSQQSQLWAVALCNWPFSSGSRLQAHSNHLVVSRNSWQPEYKGYLWQSAYMWGRHSHMLQQVYTSKQCQVHIKTEVKRVRNIPRLKSQNTAVTPALLSCWSRFGFSEMSGCVTLTVNKDCIKQNSQFHQIIHDWNKLLSVRIYQNISVVDSLK